MLLSLPISIVPLVYCLLIVAPAVYMLFPFPFFGLYVMMIPYVAAVILLKRHEITITKRDVHIWVLLITAVVVDKSHDFIATGSLHSFGPIVYSSIVAFFMLSCKKESFVSIWKGIFYSSLFAGIFMLVCHYYRSDGNLYDVSNEISTLLFVVFVVLYYSKPHSRFWILLIPCFTWGVLYARAGTIAILIFIVSSMIIRKDTPIKLKKRYFISYIMALAVLTGAVIFYEFAYVKSRSIILAERGIIWYYFCSEVINENPLLGLSNCPKFMNKRIDSVDPADYRMTQARMTSIGIHSHSHNGFVYIFYNSGIVGLTLTLMGLYMLLSRMQFYYRNLNIITGALFIYLFAGRFLIGTELAGILVFIVFVIPLRFKRDQRACPRRSGMVQNCGSF